MADNDDDVLESWEDADTEEFERRVVERQKQFAVEEETPGIKSNSESSRGPLEIQTQLPLRIQDSDRTEYVAPIKILKRQPNQPGSSEGELAVATSSRQHKSLAEREAEYASVRARILGAPEDSPSPSPPKNQRRTEASSSSECVKRLPKGPTASSRGFHQ